MVEGAILNRAVFALGMVLSGSWFLWWFNRIRFGQANDRAQDIFLGRAVLLYFSVPTAPPCKNLQRPALDHVKSTLREQIEVIEVDIAEQPNFARSWGVFSVPTIYVIDARGKVRHIHHGVTQAEKLLAQLQRLQ